MSTESKYLLILGCSQRKRQDSGFLPAIERYDGVNFRVLRKAMRETDLARKNLDILIISAKYGLLERDSPIEYYEQKMTAIRALELQNSTSIKLTNYLKGNHYDEIFINLGKNYLKLLYKPQYIRKVTKNVIYANGGIGKKMGQMKAWLREIVHNQ